MSLHHFFADIKFVSDHHLQKLLNIHLVRLILVKLLKVPFNLTSTINFPQSVLHLFNTEHSIVIFVHHCEYEQVVLYLVKCQVLLLNLILSHTQTVLIVYYAFLFHIFFFLDPLIESLHITLSDARYDPHKKLHKVNLAIVFAVQVLI